MSDAAKSDSEDEEIKRRVMEQLDALDVPGKHEVLDFSRALVARGLAETREPRTVGDTGGALLAFAGTIPKDDLEIIGRTIEEGCERIYGEGW